ncbi:unnamed protein product [Blepharisma stoltei]|uniref:Uncharacterized protein n=1 Tax=Blepharisma stoltei TaxID=1481888 RepID=A0AAU9IW93_9CILI|nr:unnamed protein product [Blepharisma stoltei]
MELRAKLVCAVTIYCGLYYLMGSLSTPASIFFFIVIAIANIYFLVYWAYYLLKSLFSAIFKKVGNLRTRRKVQSQSAVRSLRSSLEESRLVSRSVNLSIISNDNLLSESQAPVSTAKNDKENFEESSKIISV